MNNANLNAVIAKIKARRALATSANVHEAAAAAAQAEALLQKHRLDEAALEGSGEPTEGPHEATEPLDWHKGHLAWWRVNLGSTLLRNHGCVDYVDTRGSRRCHIIVGRPSDVATVRYLYAWLTSEIGRLRDQHLGMGRSWRNSFCLGAVDGISAAMKAAKAEARNAATSSALVAVDRRDRDSRDLLARLHPKLRASSGGAGSRDNHAYGQGVVAGRNIHLGGALDTTSTARQLGSGR
jgi:hypothetical protein